MAFAGAVAQVMVFPANAFADATCWSRLDGAITRRAQQTLPPYISYHVQRTVALPDGRSLVTDESVLYRTSDGEARVVDSLFGDVVMHSAAVVPGPPFVGPGGANRSAWVDTGGDGHVIAVVHSHSARACDVLGTEDVNGHPSMRLHVTPYRDGSPGLRDMWIGLAHGEIWRATVVQPLDLSAITGATGVALVDYHIDVAPINGQALVRRVTYDLPQSRMSVVYLFSDYRFLKAPDGAF